MCPKTYGHFIMQITIMKEQRIYGYEIAENDGVCGACKENLKDPCVECKLYNQTNCQICRGQCGHSFHLHCIS